MSVIQSFVNRHVLWFVFCNPSLHVALFSAQLEISMNVSDVLGTDESEHALCSQPVCAGAQDELVLSTEHQLDLLVVSDPSHPTV